MGNVVVHNMMVGGGYGRRGGSQDFVRYGVLVAKEVGRGLVTRDGAKAYGVVLNTKGAVDEAALHRVDRQRVVVTVVLKKLSL